MYLAHLEINEEDRKEQLLKDHLQHTAQYAGESLSEIGLGNIGYLAGILHDMGKYSSKYQKYLEKAAQGESVVRGSVDHSSAAEIFIYENYEKELALGEDDYLFKRITSEILEYAAMSHHGLVDCDNDGKDEFLRRAAKDKKEIEYDDDADRYLYEVISKEEIDNLFIKACREVKEVLGKLKAKKMCVPFIMGMLNKLVLSAVVYGDRKDTKEFYLNISEEKNDNIKFWKKQINVFEEKIQQFKPDTDIKIARAYISENCKKFAENKEGVYTLSVPTGAGKTLSTMRFALHHAYKYNKNRIIFVIPLLSILEQNSEVIHRYISDSNKILEVHSNVINKFESKDELDRYELVNATWNKAIIITTLVQLLNSMFSGRMENVQHFQALTNSVIIIDEVQTIPQKFINMFNMTINFLTYACRSTVILSSATQPCFEKTKHPVVFENIKNMIQPDNKLWKAFERTEIINAISKAGKSADEISAMAEAILKEANSVLIITNTRNEAAELYTLLDGKYQESNINIEHLSNNMCQAHRTESLNRIKTELDEGNKVICVSTSLIEAGVDFEKKSFESVIRYSTGLDSIAQSAGRCNRNGEYNKKCKVYIVKYKNENLKHLSEIQKAQNSLMGLIQMFEVDERKYDNLLSLKSIDKYYELLFKDCEKKLNYPVSEDESMYNLLSLFNKNVNDMGNSVFKQKYKTAARYFNVFDTDTFDVIVPYDKDAKEIIEKLCECDERYDMKEICELVDKSKPYIVHMFDYSIKKLKECGMIYEDKRCYILNQECYDDKLGVVNRISEDSFIL